MKIGDKVRRRGSPQVAEIIADLGKKSAGKEYGDEQAWKIRTEISPGVVDEQGAFESQLEAAP